MLNESVTPPFSIEDGIETDETTRMKWRYLGVKFIGYACDTYLFYQKAKADVDAFVK